MVATRRLTELVDRLEGLLRLPEGDLVVALSGGADSAALAYLLNSGALPARALHVNHGLSASARLEAAAARIAGSLGMEIEVVNVAVPDGASPEGQARTARYRAFRDSVGPRAALLAAHTLEDQAETVLMNLLRGTGPRGLSGIPWFRPPNIYRPMLRVSRSQTRELASLAGLDFYDDPMNEETGLTRNAIRLEVLPNLVRFNPQLVSSLAQMADAVRADSEYLDREAVDAGVIYSGDTAQVAVGSLTSIDPVVANRVLSGMIGRFREHPVLTSDELGRVWRVILGSSAREQLAGGLVARRSGPMLDLGPPGDSPEFEEIQLIPGRHKLGRTVFEVERADRICRVAPLGAASAIFDPAASLVASQMDSGVAVEADGVLAWVPWVKRHPVAWYQPGSTGYLSVSAREEPGWTSSP